MPTVTLTQKLHIFAVAVALIVTTALANNERATPEEAQALVASAIEFYDQAGQDAAFAAFEDGDGEFVDRDLYIFVFGPERKIVAHGGDAELVGTTAESLRDVDDVPFGTMFMDESTESGSWIDYKWRDPISGEVHPKSSWVVVHEGYVFGAGIYSP